MNILRLGGVRGDNFIIYIDFISARMIGSSQKENRDLGFVLVSTFQQRVVITFRKLFLPDEFKATSHTFTLSKCSSTRDRPHIKHI